MAYMQESNHFQIVKHEASGKYYVATWRESYAYSGKLGGGFFEIDPLKHGYLGWQSATEGDALFPDFDDAVRGRMLYVTSEEFYTWIKESEAKEARRIEDEKSANSQKAAQAQREANAIARNGWQP